MNLCLRCRKKIITCLCSQLKPFSTESRFIILMHPMEAKKERMGTGRPTHLILKNSELLTDVSFDQNQRFQTLLHDPAYESFLLYPAEEHEALDLGGEDLKNTLKNSLKKKAQFFVIDGTWPCAKKMMKLTKSIHLLPRVSFKTQRLSEFKIKHQPLPGCLSTVESIYQVLIELNRMKIENTAPKEENLMEVFRFMVKLQLEFAQDPLRSGYRRKAFSVPSERKISKKWSKRLLFYSTKTSP